MTISKLSDFCEEDMFNGRMSARLIHFRIDDTVSTVWKRMSLTPEEQKARTEKLRADLDEVYRKFVLAQYSEFDELKQTLMKAKHTFLDTKELYADIKVQIPEVEALLITDQIKCFEEATADLNQEYQERRDSIQNAFGQLTRLFDQLGYRLSGRGDFTEPPKRDFTPAQLSRAQQRILSLKEEKRGRCEVLGIMKSDSRN
jgi:phage regulator Rha-like protein